MKNRKLAAGIGGVSVVAAALAITAGTYALFTDEETGGVTATAGTMDLVVTGLPEDGRFTVANVAPGDSFGPETIVFTNEGSVDGKLALSIAKTTDQEGDVLEPELDLNDTAETGELDEVLRVTVNSDYGTHTFKLNDLSGPYVLPNTLVAGGSTDITVTMFVPEEAGSKIQSDAAGFTVTGELTQVN